MDQSPRSFDRKRRKPSWALKETQEPATLFRGLINFMNLLSMALDGPWLGKRVCSSPEAHPNSDRSHTPSVINRRIESCDRLVSWRLAL
jgi:hypothetical protein